MPPLTKFNRNTHTTHTHTQHIHKSHRYRYSLDLGAFYFNVLRVDKQCMPAATPCANTSCVCTTSPPYYDGACSNWARAACRRKLYICINDFADYIRTQVAPTLIKQ